ncbi:MAG: hypothetical protein J6K89_04185, partial [Oscillospiraceae bacterium]|nr:hypothetical protein [Oscillospiraceae bacterium]
TRILSRFAALLLTLAMVLSILPTSALGATAVAEEQPALRSTDPQDGIVGMWLWNDTMSKYGASTLFSHYAKTGVTDVYLLIKGTYGSVNISALNTACNAAKSYGIRVHAWIMAARDDTFLNSNSGANYFHFRTGYSWTSNSEDDVPHGYVNLRNTAYRNYMVSLVKQLAGISNLAGIHLDTIRYGSLYYDWGMEARDLALTKYGITHDQWNAAVQAMCVSGEYQYRHETKTTAGYNGGQSYTAYTYIQSGGYTPTGPNFDEALLLNDNSDVAIGCKAVAQMRIDTVTDFVKLMKENCGNKILTAALMPEALGDVGFRSTYGQSPEHMAPYVDYITPMIYAVEFGMPSSWVADLSRQAAAVGCNVVPGLQAYQTMDSGRPTDGAWGTGKTLYNDVQEAMKLAREINHDDENYGGNILGVAFFQSGTMSMAAATYDASKSMLTFNMANLTLSSVSSQNIKGIRFTLMGDLRFDKNKIAESKSYADFTNWNTVVYSSDYKTVTVYDDTNVLSPQQLRNCGFYVTGTPDWANGVVMIEASSTGNSFTDVLYGTSRPIYCTMTHSHSYTATPIQQATCSQEGIVRYTCSCGMSYDATTPALAHTPVAVEAIAATCISDGRTAGTKCSVCGTILSGCEPITSGGHQIVTQDGKPATCTDPGLTEGSYCSLCGEVFTAQSQIPALGHSPVTDAGYAATCTTPGKTDGSHCSVCSAVLVKQEVIAPTGHTPEIIPGTPASCLNSGISDGEKCSVCNTILLAQQILPRLGHSYDYTDNGDGTHTGSCERCGKTLAAAAHSYDGEVCTLCGSGANLPEVDSSIQIRHTLNLASDISINYMVSADSLAAYDSYYLEVSIPKYNGNQPVGSSTVKIDPVLNNGYYYFTLTGITAVQMGDQVEAVLYMSKNGNTTVSATDRYSVAAYVYSQLAKEGSTAELKTLCADLLRYGAAAQRFKSYRVDAPADGSMTLDQIMYLSDVTDLQFGDNYAVLNDVQKPSITWVGKALNLESKVVLRFVFDAASYAGNVEDLQLRISYKNYAGQTVTATVTDPKAYGTVANRYTFDFDGLLAAELRSVVTVAVFDGQEQVSPSMRYSADSYGIGKEGALLDLCQCLIAYSDSALAYFQ